jgi:hypothetical protein
MQKIFLATIYLVSVISTVSAADILSCQSEMKYSQSAIYDLDNKPMKAGVCRDPYMTLCEGPYPDTTQHYDLPVSSMKATDLEYRAEFPAPDSGEGRRRQLYSTDSGFIVSQSHRWFVLDSMDYA